jgi:hypothetical protein
MFFVKNHSKKEYLLFALVGFSAYWFANAVLWIPWKINQLFGIVMMLLIVPILWGLSTLYCLIHIPIERRKNAKFIIAIIFLFVSVVSDYFFFAIWRGIPEELYHPTTFAAYALIAILPIIIGTISKKKDSKKISNKIIFVFIIMGILFLGITLYSVQYW